MRVMALPGSLARKVAAAFRPAALVPMITWRKNDFTAKSRGWGRKIGLASGLA